MLQAVFRCEKVSDTAANRQQPHARRIEPTADGEQGQAGDAVQCRSRQSDPGFRVAADTGRGGDDPGDQRGLGEVTPVETARPKPVLRLVRMQLQRRDEQHEGAHDDEGGGEGKGDPQVQVQARPSDPVPVLARQARRLGFNHLGPIEPVPPRLS